jgi:hypothetical protein
VNKSGSSRVEDAGHQVLEELPEATNCKCFEPREIPVVAMMQDENPGTRNSRSAAVGRSGHSRDGRRNAAAGRLVKRELKTLR